MAAAAVEAMEGEESSAAQRADTMEKLQGSNARSTESDLQHLQEWLGKQPHLPHMSDAELLQFLKSNAWSLERAKACVDKCLTMRTHAPQLFSGRDPSDPRNQEQLRAFRVARLPVTTSGGQRLVCLGYAPPEASCVAFDGARSLALSTALMELVALGEEPGSGGEGPESEGAAGDGGLVLVLDAAHATPAHIAATPILSLQTLLTFVQEAAPLRVSAVHVVRLGPVGRRALALIKPFMGAALQAMMHFHTDNLEEFHKEFPPEMLPEELGGSCGSIAEYHEELVRELTRRRAWLLANEARLVDESKRPATTMGSAGGTGGAHGLFGAHGSFRTLDVD